MKVQALLCLALVVIPAAAPAWAAFVPWEPLTGDSWVYFGSPQTRIHMYAANAGSYEVGFDQLKADGSARGENALRFSYGGTTVGHLATDQLAGSFGVAYVGGARNFRDVLVLVAIDAPALPPGFALSLGQGGSSYQFNPAADFGYYSHPEYSTGRPSGYYSATSPKGEGIGYNFTQGMVSVYAAQNVNLAPNGTLTFSYTFTDLPGKAVFSVYGLDASVGWIYHTNRGLPDTYLPSSPVSTFEVVPEPTTILLLLSGAALLLKGNPWRARMR